MNTYTQYIPDTVGPTLDFFAGFFALLIIPAIILALVFVGRKKSPFKLGFVCFPFGLVLITSVFVSLAAVYGRYEWDKREEIEHWLNGQFHMSWQFNQALEYMLGSTFLHFLLFSAMVGMIVFAGPKFVADGEKLRRQGIALGKKLESMRLDSGAVQWDKSNNPKSRLYSDN